jgi:hypothetical protein
MHVKKQYILHLDVWKIVVYVSKREKLIVLNIKVVSSQR